MPTRFSVDEDSDDEAVADVAGAAEEEEELEELDEEELEELFLPLPPPPFLSDDIAG